MGWLPPLLAFAWIALGCGVLPEEPRRYLSAVLQQYAGGLQTRPLLYHEPGIGEGHGSRWLGILTCFYLALAANRTLHVLWPTTQPGRGHLMPPLASLYTTHAIMQPSTDRLTFEALKHVALFKVSYGASYTNLSAVLHITSAPFASSLGPQRPALCHSTQWIGPLLRCNRAESNEFVRRTRSHPTLFAQLRDFLFQPTAAARSLASAAADGRDFALCLHLRFNSTPAALAQLLQCASTVYSAQRRTQGPRRIFVAAFSSSALDQVRRALNTNSVVFFPAPTLGFTPCPRLAVQPHPAAAPGRRRDDAGVP
eukprot:GGOE01022679.1.p1 GENE.GGOE01022679.1~~GGOE01022679.1.p1  ORF type:complete len:311 (-),score=55.78 GGOE01022679.1:644-1576(-)